MYTVGQVIILAIVTPFSLQQHQPDRSALRLLPHKQSDITTKEPGWQHYIELIMPADARSRRALLHWEGSRKALRTELCPRNWKNSRQLGKATSLDTLTQIKKVWTLGRSSVTGFTNNLSALRNKSMALLWGKSYAGLNIWDLHAKLEVIMSKWKNSDMISHVSWSGCSIKWLTLWSQ